MDEQTTPAVAPPEAVTEVTEAPFGYKADGTPRKSRAGRPPKAPSSASSASSPRAPRAPRAPSAKRTAPKRAPAGPDYRPAIMGLIQLPAGALMAAGMVRPELALDGYTLAMHGPNVAEALNDLARENPGVAAMLDRVLQVGPYGALIAAMVPMGVQIAVNHGLLPAGFMGAMKAEQIRAMAEQDARQMAAAA